MRGLTEAEVIGDLRYLLVPLGIIQQIFGCLHQPPLPNMGRQRLAGVLDENGIKASAADVLTLRKLLGIQLGIAKGGIDVRQRASCSP